ncbi:histidine kinase dimerization/phosphoacceptor domain -containing protein [Micromonospora sp. BRA006-A]|nr:histidine kinase dimerization/phosphoacceptor domain -containing protein [Micromonospora sp. BRA006-A]
MKNNLQTVAALLRLQARRVAMPEARVALEESVRRVASIALVHETLSRPATRRSSSTASSTGSPAPPPRSPPPR